MNKSEREREMMKNRSGTEKPLGSEKMRPGGGKGVKERGTKEQKLKRVRKT